MSKQTPLSIPDFKRIITDYYDSWGRSFPWRETQDPYNILVSEIMLQQTQTERVVPRYIQWLERFPTIDDLATASFDTVLSSWVGLGYNRRAKYLHETSKIIQNQYKSVFPVDSKELQKLPGLGHYTANAVSTFAFNQPNIFIETNIRAVYIFFFFSHCEKVKDQQILEQIAESIDSQNPRHWYYALMDYGADLKRKIQNPNRQAASYSKQSKFTGSARQARGSVLRYLAREKCGTPADIARCEGIEQHRIEGVLPALLKEGMVAETDGKYCVYS